MIVTLFPSLVKYKIIMTMTMFFISITSTIDWGRVSTDKITKNKRPTTLVLESSARKLITGPLGKGNVHLGKRVHGPITQLNNSLFINTQLVIIQ